MEKPTPNLQDKQKDPVDWNKQKEMEPHEWYNKHVRKEGEPILTAEQFAAKKAQVIADREKPAEIPGHVKKYPLTEEDASTNTGESD